MIQISRFCVLLLIVTSQFLSAESFKVGVLQDLPYGMHASQKMDIYLPSFPVDASNHLTVLMLHGGSDKADSAIVANKVQRWVPQRVIFASANYRQAIIAKPVVQIRDVAQALAMVQRKITAWGGDADKVILMGYGDGAYLATLLSMSPDVLAEEGVSPWLGTIALSPVGLDVVSTMENSRTSKFENWFGTDLNYWKTISPLHQLEHAEKPLLIVCSTLSSEDDCTAADELKFAATPLEKEVEIMTVRLDNQYMSDSLGKENDYTMAIESFINRLYQSNDETKTELN
ncbi:hypothetical protein CBF23_007815 [Marinomonas agarivorans]|nr:hypothetical protein CBF23_007815 [Marinomonas agarivorans]